ncbi:MAG: Lrp/AsnC ligand binding domain-containing protein, partial [Burkholderiaceae bacterium]
HQSSELMDAFEKRAVADDQVAMCWRVSSGPDFVLMIQVSDMPDYLLLVKRMFSSDANVRNLKVFFSTKQCKLVPSIPLPSSI